MDLETYSKELGITAPMTLESLIESHRHLRSLNLEYNNKWQKGHQEGFDQGFSKGISDAVERGCLSVERLRAMTLAELTELLAP